MELGSLLVFDATCSPDMSHDRRKEINICSELRSKYPFQIPYIVWNAGRNAKAIRPQSGPDPHAVARTK